MYLIFNVWLLCLFKYKMVSIFKVQMQLKGQNNISPSPKMHMRRYLSNHRVQPFFVAMTRFNLVYISISLIVIEVLILKYIWLSKDLTSYSVPERTHCEITDKMGWRLDKEVVNIVSQENGKQKFNYKNVTNYEGYLQNTFLSPKFKLES